MTKYLLLVILTLGPLPLAQAASKFTLTPPKSIDCQFFEWKYKQTDDQKQRGEWTGYWAPAFYHLLVNGTGQPVLSQLDDHGGKRVISKDSSDQYILSPNFYYFERVKDAKNAKSTIEMKYKDLRRRTARFVNSRGERPNHYRWPHGYFKSHYRSFWVGRELFLVDIAA